jgi:hypothetical protein
VPAPQQGHAKLSSKLVQDSIHIAPVVQSGAGPTHLFSLFGGTTTGLRPGRCCGVSLDKTFRFKGGTIGREADRGRGHGASPASMAYLLCTPH